MGSKRQYGTSNNIRRRYFLQRLIQKLSSDASLLILPFGFIALIIYFLVANREGPKLAKHPRNNPDLPPEAPSKAKPRIAVIIPYLGEAFPTYFPLFAQSAGGR